MDHRGTKRHKKLKFVILFLLIFTVISQKNALAQNSMDGKGAAAVAGNASQTIASAAALGVNMPLCTATPPSPMNCAMAALDIVGMLASVLAQGGNQNMQDTVKTDPSKTPELSNPNFKSSRSPYVAALKSVCTSTPALCRCQQNSNDPSCTQKIIIPENLKKELSNTLMSLSEPGLSDKLNFPNILGKTPEEALEKYGAALAQLQPTIDKFNEALDDKQNINPSEISNDMKPLLEANKNIKQGLAGSEYVSNYSSLLEQLMGSKNPLVNEVQFSGMDVEDMVTGRKLSLFDRASRRYYGNVNFQRAFTMARLELMRKQGYALRNKKNDSLPSRSIASEGNSVKIEGLDR